MIGTMSAATVRAAQLGRICIFRVHDLARQPRHRRDDVGTGARQPDVGRVDPEGLHEVQNLAPCLRARGS